MNYLFQTLEEEKELANYRFYLSESGLTYNSSEHAHSLIEEDE